MSTLPTRFVFEEYVYLNIDREITYSFIQKKNQNGLL